VRELENVIQRAVVMLRQTTIDVGDFAFGPTNSGPVSKLNEVSSALPTTALGPSLANRQLEEIERVAILSTLDSARGNKTEAARRLGVTGPHALQQDEAVAFDGPGGLRT
jgi:DNA-binding NtrC family response regulator